MCKRLHPDILSAKRKAEGYRILPRPHGGGFNTWRFRSWSLTDGGGAVVDISSTREIAASGIRQRLGLEPAVVVTVEPEIQPADPYFACGGYEGFEGA